MDLIPLHKFPQYTERCIELLNEEWPRSVYARTLSLSKSCDQLPTSLILLNTTNENNNILFGHSKLCKIPNNEHECWLEGVVIFKSERGKGYGRILMEKTENYAKKIGFTTIYLSTHDKRDFYAHLGYFLCPPVVNLGANANLLNKPQFESFTRKLAMNDVEDSMICRTNVEEIEIISCTNNNSPIPPPPPPPSLLNNKLPNNNVPVQVYMKKVL